MAPGLPFLDALAAAWLRDRGEDPLAIMNGLILTPTRRAARSLADAFLRVSGGKGLLLPRIIAFGSLQENPLRLEIGLDLPSAVNPSLRLSVLTHLILKMNGADGAPRTADRAWLLAIELAALIDEADRAEIDLAVNLPDAADPAFAAHWARTLEFLHIVTHWWPDWLAENGVMNPVARQIAMLNAQTRAWQEQPPNYRVVIAGTTAGIKAVAALARVVARLPLGQVVLPVLDTLLLDEAAGTIEDAAPVRCNQTRRQTLENVRNSYLVRRSFRLPVSSHVTCLGSERLAAACFFGARGSNASDTARLPGRS